MFGKTNHIHFVGIGGIGMSGMAELLHKLGFNISGSDQNRSERTDNLKEAERWCNESLVYAPDTHPWLPGLNNVLLSMIYFKTNRQSESEEAHETAKQCLSNLQGNENSLHDTFLMELLIKERELLARK